MRTHSLLSILVAFYLCTLGSINSSRLFSAESNSAAIVLSNFAMVGGQLSNYGLVMNPFFDNQWQNGQRYIMQLHSLDDRQLQSDNSLELSFYNAVDQDLDPLNDFSGTGLFELLPISLNADGSPVDGLHSAELQNSMLSASAPLITQMGSMPMHQFSISGEFLYSHPIFEFQSLSSSCALSADFLDSVPSHIGGQSILQAISILGALPDVDLDLDGSPEAFSLEFSVDGIRAGIANPLRAEIFMRGDGNADGSVNIADAISLLGYLFLESSPPACERAADADQNSRLQLPDTIILLGVLFSGQSLPAPWPGCGSIPNASFLTCENINCP